MIHLDTNLLVEVVTVGSFGGAWLRDRVRGGATLATCAVAWSEFCNGPLTTPQKDAAYAVLAGRIVEFTWKDAEEAARLFNRLGRRRGSHADCMIAAVAMRTGAGLATRNEADFIRMEPFGLRLLRVGEWERDQLKP